MNTQQETIYFEDLIAGEKPVLINFTAGWCYPCKVLTPVLDQIEKEAEGQLRIVKIDVDVNPQVASACKVSAVPTLLLFKEGVLVWRKSGVLSAGQMKEVLQGFAQIHFS